MTTRQTALVCAVLLGALAGQATALLLITAADEQEFDSRWAEMIEDQAVFDRTPCHSSDRAVCAADINVLFGQKADLPMVAPMPTP